MTKSLRELHDVELAVQAAAGGRREYGELVRRHGSAVRGLLRRMGAAPSLADDVAQDAFIRAYRAIGNFRGDAQFYTWMHRIAINTAKNHLVAMKRRPPTADIDAGDAEHYDGALQMRDTDTPERELLRHEVEQSVMRTVNALPKELRQAITLREVEGLPYDEIARRLDCPIGTVRSRIFRAREAIDRELRPLLDANATSRERGRS